MNATSKKVAVNRFKSAYRSAAHREAHEALKDEIWKYQEQMRFLISLGLAMTLQDDFDYSPEDCADLLDKVSAKIKELGIELQNNTYTEGDSTVPQYDIDYNRVLLERYAGYYGVRFIENAFDTKY